MVKPSCYDGIYVLPDLQRLGLGCRDTVKKKVKSGFYPKPFYLSDAPNAPMCWDANVIDAFIASLVDRKKGDAHG